MAWPISGILRRAPVAAVVIGTMSPDFEYLLRLAPRGQVGHSLAGVVLVCVPASVVLWLAFERYARAALGRTLPPAIGLVLSGAGGGRAGPPGAALAWAAAGALLGALSHVAWDSFTHASGWAVLRIRVLANPIELGVLNRIPAFKLLQHGSTAAGLIVLILWGRRTAARGRLSPGTHPAQPGTWRTMAVLSGASAIGAALNAARVLARGPAQILGHAAVGSMVGLLLAVIAVVVSSVRAADRRTNR